MDNLSKIFFLLLFSITVFAQGVCDTKTGIEKGGFALDGPSTVCIGQAIKLKDVSGGTDVKYIFGYQGDPASKLSSIGSTTSPTWTFLAAGQYTILQYGKKNGKDMYYCDVVWVREDNKPDISYEACNNTTIILTIRDSPANNFDSYRIKWANGNVDNIPVGTILPYSLKKTFPTAPTQHLLIEGLYTIPNNCPAPQPISVTMDRGAMFPRIEKLELSEDGKEATITLKGNPDAEYNLSSRSIDQSGTPIKFLPDKVKVGVFKVPITDKAKSQCFFVGRFGTLCQEYSNEVCTMPFTLVPKDDKYEISWQNPALGKIQNTGIYTFINQSIPQLSRDENGSNKVNFTSINSPYIDNTADCTKKYCYTLSSTITSTYAGYTNPVYIETATVSQKQCIDRKTIHPPAITDGFVTVNQANAIQVSFNDNSTWALERKKYRLYRSEITQPKQIDSSIIVKSFLDASINASEKSYCYKVSFVDKCDSESELSPSFCSIFLYENTLLNLTWTNVSPFGSTAIKQFDVLSYHEQTNAIATETTKTASETSYVPMLDKFEEEAKYQIKTIAFDGKESFSNILTIPIAVKLFLPDTFTPNGDTINDELAIVGTTKRIIDFEIQIYNRWGNLVFISTAINNHWDGTFQNSLAPADTYTYKIHAKLNDGKALNKTGKFLLLR